MTTTPTTAEAERRRLPSLAELRTRALLLTEARWAPYVALGSVVSFAFLMYAWGASSTGYGNTYYAAAVRSMALSWHNFFFASFDPGGFITVDKPPVFLWFGALSARIFGYSSWSILLPSAVAGAASVALMWLCIRRYFGTLAATISALVLAVTPVSVAVDRLNLPEPFMILALVGGAYCTIRSLEARRWWAWAAAAGLLVGVAFNTKMLAAWIPGPAFALALLVGWAGPWRQALRPTLGRLAVLGAVTLLASASWMLVVDNWPASSRPYIGGSTDNTVQDLVLGYNGFGRVDGESQGAGGGGPGGQRGFPAGAPGAGAGTGAGQVPAPPNLGNATQGLGTTGQGTTGQGTTGQGTTGQGTTGQGTTGQGTTGQGTTGQGTTGQGTTQGAARGTDGGGFTPPAQQGGGAAAAGPGGGTGAGGIIAGNPGWGRMFDAANGGQIAWLLPFALLGIAGSLWMYRRERVQRSAIVLWGGWILLYGGIFSFAEGIYHSYYTSALAPGIAALVGITVAGLVTKITVDRRWWFAALGLALVTVAVQLEIAGRVPGFFGEFRYVAIAILAAAMVALALVRSRRLVAFAMAGVVGALLVIPTTWSMSEAFNPPLNTTLPQAGPRAGTSGRTFGSETFDSDTDPLAAWLKANADPDARWQLVVPSAMNASTLVAEYPLSVMPIGGFSGRDAAITVDQFADLVGQGDVRYVLASQNGGFGGGVPGGGDGGGLGGLGGFGNVPGVDGGARRAADGQGAAGGLGTQGTGTGAADGGLGTQGTGTGAAGAQGTANQGAGGAQAGPGGSSSAVLTVVRSVCTVVTDTTLPAANQGSMYDCAGKAEALHAAG